MKTSTFPFLAALLLIFSCSKYDDNNTSNNCTDRPLENIPWLKELVDNETDPNNVDFSGLEIIQYQLNGETVFFVDSCINNCADSLAVVYDCERNTVCEFGGIAGLNTCPDFDTEATNRIVLFSTRKSEKCDKSVIIDGNLYEKSKTDRIEKAIINGDCLDITFSLLITQNSIDDVDLIDSGLILESEPIQRNLKFTIKENLTKPISVNATTSFDLSSLATPGQTILINLDGFEEQIKYTRASDCKNCELTQPEERELLNKMFDELLQISQSVPCETPIDWRFTAVGSKACGGPAGYLPYSTKINVADFLEKIKIYTNAEDQFNRKWGVISTCDVTPAPTAVECKDGKALLVFTTINMK